MSKRHKSNPPQELDSDPDSRLELKTTPSSFEVLVIGAGGLGCEIVKNLALVGFRRISIVDMDTIELTNLNRQFLFREADIGLPKAEVAARAVMAQCPDCIIDAQVSAIQDLPDAFYHKFDFVVCGLDSVSARRWINGKLCELAKEPGAKALKPLIDGGSEGLMGQTRVIIAGISACYECTLGINVDAKAQQYPLCTLAATPRLPEHCIAWALVFAWPRDFPELSPDLDDPSHIQWLSEQAINRASEFGIEGVTLSLVYGVIKRIIPAVAATNAVIAGSCCLEALKLATGDAPLLDNYCMYSGKSGVYTQTFSLERRTDCPVCGSEGSSVNIGPEESLRQLLQILRLNLRIESPSVTVRGKSLYMQAPPSLREQLRPNLEKPVNALFSSGDELAVTDPLLPFPLKVECYFTS